MYIVVFITPLGNTYFGMPDRYLKRLFSYQWEEGRRYRELMDLAIEEFSPLKPCDMPTADITVSIKRGVIDIRKLDMLRLGDILQKLKILIADGCVKEEVEDYFGWDVESILMQEDDEECDSFVQIVFANQVIIEAYREDGEIEEGEEPFCIFRIKKLTDIAGTLDYDINSIGLWIDLEGAEIRAIFGTNGHFMPSVRKKCVPLLSKFSGFFEEDYFGIESRSGSIYIYYSLVCVDGEEEDAKFVDILLRFAEIEKELVNGDWEVLEDIEDWIPV